MIELTMEQVRSMFDRSVFERGMGYFNEGKIHHVRHTLENGRPKMECRIQGDGFYQVTLVQQESGRLQCSCSCFQFYFHRTCKHLAAAMIHCARNPKGRVVSDWNARNLLKTYMERSSRMEPERSDARLLPRLSGMYPADHEYPTLSFRVGREKLYVVKHLANFLTDVHRRNTVMLGKNVELDHSIESFDERSRKLIRILMNEQEEFRAIGSSHRNSYSHSGYGNSKNEITLTGDAFDRFFDLFCGEDVETYSGGTIRFCAEDPQVTLKLRKGEHSAKLTVEAGEDTRFFGHVGAWYACDGKRLLRCSEPFREKVYPLLRLRRSEMEFSYEDLPDFCGCVLPEIEGFATVEAPEGLLEQYLPEECTPCFYFDMEDEVLSLKLRFRYGEQEYPEERTEGEKLHRDSRAERRASIFAQRYFEPTEDGYFLSGEEAVYDFLTEDLNQFREHGEV